MSQKYVEMKLLLVSPQISGVRWSPPFCGICISSYPYLSPVTPPPFFYPFPACLCVHLLSLSLSPPLPPFSNLSHSPTNSFLCTVPTVPNAVTVTTSGVGSLTVTWNPPDTLNAPSVQYEIFYTSDTSSNTSSVDTMIILEGLAAYTVYSITIRACSVAGCGPFSTEVSERTQEEGI